MFRCVVNLKSVNKLDLTWKQSFLIIVTMVQSKLKFTMKFSTYPQPQDTAIWLGATDIENEGAWFWKTTGNALNYTRFIPNYPSSGNNGNCLMMQNGYGYWDDMACAFELSYHVCEKQTVPPSTQPLASKKKVHIMLQTIETLLHFAAILKKGPKM
jgi:hypothetical protein